MNLKTAIESVSWQRIKEVLKKVYPDTATMSKGFHGVFELVHSLEPGETNMRLYIEERDDDDETFDEVLGLDGSLDQDGREIRYALDFRPWEEWLAMEIDPGTLERYSTEEIVAHCLYEMTFYGFDQESIKQQGQELLDRIKNLDESELIPWEFDDV